MRNPWTRLPGAIARGGTALLLLGLICQGLGARVNTSKSIPLGLYWTSEGSATKGAYVQLCPPPTELFAMARERGYLAAGFCPGGYGYMLKRVVAGPNDSITIAAEGVRVNGTLQPFSAPRRSDQGGRLLPLYRCENLTLGQEEVLLLSEVSATSFDGRYFGPINRAQIKSLIRPVVTW